MRIFIYIGFILLTFSSCIWNTGKRIKGNGILKTEERDVQDANKIQLLGSMDVYLEAGPTNMRVEADENILPYIVTRFEDGWLTIKSKDHTNLKSKNAIKVIITTPEISHLKIRGSGNITGDDKFISESKVKFDIAGSGNIQLNVHAPSVDAGIMGSGNIKLGGETRNIDVDIAGSGNFEGDNLKSENAKVDIKGSGDADVYAELKLKAFVAGSGNIKYRGNASVEKHMAGSGAISKIP